MHVVLVPCLSFGRRLQKIQLLPFRDNQPSSPVSYLEFFKIWRYPWRWDGMFELGHSYSSKTPGNCNLHFGSFWLSSSSSGIAPEVSKWSVTNWFPTGHIGVSDPLPVGLASLLQSLGSDWPSRSWTKTWNQKVPTEERKINILAHIKVRSLKLEKYLYSLSGCVPFAATMLSCAGLFCSKTEVPLSLLFDSIN